MAYRELELTLQSARDLKNVNLFTRMDVYAVASICGDPMTRQCTATDTSGGRNPSWDAKVRFSVPPSAEKAGSDWLHVLLRSERALGDRDVGEVVVPLADLLAGADGPGQQPPRLASYQVHTVHRGDPRGVLNVSYRLGPVVAPVERVYDKQPVIGYPAPEQQPKPQNPPPYQNPAVTKLHHPPRREDEGARSPANGKPNRPVIYVGPQTHITFESNTVAPKVDGARPKPSYTSTQSNTDPVKTDHHPWPKSFPQQDNATKPPTRPSTSPVKTEPSWSKPLPQNQNTPTWPNAGPKKPDRSTRPQQDTRAGEVAHAQSKISSARTADPSARPQTLRDQDNTKVSNASSGRKPSATQTQVGEYGSVQSNINPGKAESRPKEAYANSQSNSMPRAVLQHERVPSMPTATAR